MSTAVNAIVCQPTNSMIDFWCENKLNVLFIGRHGVGKTSMIIDGFKRNKLKYKYFSASTMDPFVDFIGVPKEVQDEKGSYLELIKPKDFRDDEVEAIFFDEFNRSHKKIRNAVMELIQFKTINGRPFPNLKMIWAAINPENDELATYDVEPLDKAQKDRFQIHIEIPYKPNIAYFKSKYGEDKADAVVDWWNNLPEDLKIHISPRRLDDTLNYDSIGGNIRHVLPPASNLEKLISSLKNGSPIKNLKKLIDSGDMKQVKSWLNEENNYSGVKDYLDKDDYMKTCLPLLEEEKICNLVTDSKKIAKHVFTNANDYKEVVKVLSSSSQNNKVKKEAKEVMSKILGIGTSMSKKVRIPKKKSTITNLSVLKVSLTTPYTSTVEPTSILNSLGMSTIAELNSFAISNPYMTNDIKNKWMETLFYVISKSDFSKENVYDAAHVLEYCVSRINRSTLLAYADKLLFCSNKIFATIGDTLGSSISADTYYRDNYPETTLKVYYQLRSISPISSNAHYIYVGY